MSRLAAQCVALAGALAEHAVTDLVLAPPATIEAIRSSSRRPVRLAPGHTDLPGVLTEAPPGSRLMSHEIGLVIERGTDSLIVLEAATDAAREVASCLLP